MSRKAMNLDRLSKAWQNECDGWLALGQVPGSAYHVERAGDITYAWWAGEPGAIDNYVMIGADYQGDLHSVIAPFADRIRQSRSNTVIRFVEKSSSYWWAGQAAALGFARASAVPVMARSLRRARPKLPLAPEITVRKVEDEPAYREAFEVVHGVYGGTQSITRFFNPQGPVQLYTGYWASTPAASSTLWPFAGVAGIYSVATLPEYRRRGLALATLQRQLDDAQASGYDLAILRTSDELIPFYGQLGFELVGRLMSLTGEAGRPTTTA
jgi:GNAT superfamily N-acetyltransferase